MIVFEVIAVLFIITAGSYRFFTHSKEHTGIKEQLSLILAALDTDIRNNIDLEKQLTNFLLDFLNLDITLQHEWALFSYFENKKKTVVKGYKSIKDNISIFNTAGFRTAFLGNGEAELMQLSEVFPKEFLKSILGV